jgi:feruloyl esterase
VGLASGAVLAACDGLDGVTDGMIHDLAGCTTAVVQPELVAATCAGPKADSCLSPAQVGALKLVFAGPRTSNGETIYPPWAWDAGISGQNWRAWKLGPCSAPVDSANSVGLNANALAAIFTTPPTPLPTAGGSAVAFSLTFAIDASLRAISNVSDVYRPSPVDIMRADSTDLSAFKTHGGKLVILHGVSDPVFSILDTINWWTALNKVNGGRANEFVRLFAVPGMNHTTGGPATDQFDAFGALVDWVEKGVAPERIVATARVAAPWPGRTRPCACTRNRRDTREPAASKPQRVLCAAEITKAPRTLG